MPKVKTIHIGSKRYPADKLPDKFKPPVPKADESKADKPAPAKPVKSGN